MRSATLFGEGHAGRPAIDPGILLALWIYATAEGVGSARALERLCGEHDAYRWICGGIAVSAHTLSDFRVAHGAVLDALLTQSVAQLMAEGLVELRRVAQDGLRVRASAGAASFRRRRRLREFLRAAGEQVERLRRELDENPAATSRREAAARERAARERKHRVQQALAEMGREEERRAKKAALSDLTTHQIFLIRSRSMSDVFRMLPKVTEKNAHFWRGGERGELCFLRCRPCGHYIHPPQPICPECLSKDLAPTAVSGRATVVTYTLNHQPWVPAPDHPYAIAIVEIEEQPSVRLMTNIVGCPSDQVRIGMRVQATFEHREDVYIPVFEPVKS